MSICAAVNYLQNRSSAAVKGGFRERASLALELVGALTVLRTALSLWSFVQLDLINIGYDLRRRYAKAGSYAVVTGGSDGIGFAMANELARRGFNVLIIALDQPLLYEAADKLRQHGTIVKAIPFDFAQPQATEDEAYAKLFKQIDDVPVALLVNNVGTFYRYPMPLVASPLALDTRMMTVNMNSQLRMTKYLLPRLQAAGCGGIVNLSSMSAVAAAPYLSVYAGTKGFNLMFARALAAELRGQYPGIDVLTLTPFLVVSNMTQGIKSERPAAGGRVVAAADVARQALNKLGKTQETAGAWQHSIVKFLATTWIQKVSQKDWLAQVDNAYKEAVASNAKP